MPRDTLGASRGCPVAWPHMADAHRRSRRGSDLFCTYAANFFPALETRRGELSSGRIDRPSGVAELHRRKDRENRQQLFHRDQGGVLAVLRDGGAGRSDDQAGTFAWRLCFPLLPRKAWFQAMLLLVYAYGGLRGTYLSGRRPIPSAIRPYPADGARRGLRDLHSSAIRRRGHLADAGASTRPLADAAQRFLGPAGGIAIAAGPR